MPVLESRDLLAMTGEDAMAFVQATVEVRASSGLLVIIEDAKRAAAAAPYAPIRGAETLGIPGSAGYEINRLNATLAAATKCFQAEMVRVLMSNRDLDDENARLAKKCDGLESENRTLRAQLTVHRAGSDRTEVNVETLTGADLDRLSLRYGFGSLRPSRFPGETDAEFRERVLDVVWNRVAAKPEDPRSAALARAIAVDRVSDGYAR